MTRGRVMSDLSWRHEDGSLALSVEAHAGGPTRISLVGGVAGSKSKDGWTMTLEPSLVKELTLVLKAAQVIA